MKAECNTCGNEFEAESITWARHKETGDEALGYDGEAWEGASGHKWEPTEVDEYEQQVGGVGTFGKCPACCNRYHRARERENEYNTGIAPAWFDRDFAGERWDNDY